MSYNIDILNSDLYTRDYFNQENVCRLCWNQEAVREIVPKTEQNDGVTINQLVDKIRDCLDLDLREDSYPRNACNTCCHKVEDFHNFRNFCRETNKRLQDIKNNHYISDAGTSNQVKIEYINNKINNKQKDTVVTILDYFEESIGDINNQNILNDDKHSLDKKKIRPKRFVSKLKKYSNGYSDCDSFYQLSDNDLGNSDREEKVRDTKKSKKFKTKKLRSKIKSLKRTTDKKDVSLVKKKNYIPKRSVSYCNICRTDLGSKENLSMHNSLNHGIEGGSIFKCFGCEKRFKTRKARLAHEINFCKGLKEGYKCGKCNRFLPRRSMYEAHMRDHRENPSVELPEKIFQCAKCYSLFKTKLCLKEHMLVHNTSKKNYVCETCGRVFTRQDYLHKHKLTHTGTKQHVCPHCNYRTSQKSSLTVHIRKHTGERPYSCELCPQRCISSSNLRAHARTHLGQKKFECTICNKKFGYKLSLDEHVASVHERSQAFSCEHCGAIYTRIRGLRRHLFAKHAKQDKDKELSTDGASGLEKDNASSELYIKITEDEGKKDELKDNEIFQIKESEGFVLLNAENAVLLTKMY